MRHGEADDSQRRLQLTLELDPEAELDDAERLGRQLRAELAQLDIEGVAPAMSAEDPQGAKGGAVDWGTLLVTFSVPGGVFTSLIAVARDWLVRNRSARHIEMTVDNDTIILDRSSAQEREELIGSWVRRHSDE